jgi:hypothetical protein
VLIPGIVLSRVTSVWNGRISSSMRAVSALTVAVMASMRSMSVRQRNAWWSVNRPTRASCRGGDLCPHPGSGQIGQNLRVAFAGDQRLDHRAAGHAEGVRGDGGQFDARVFQYLLQPLQFPGPLLHQAGAVSGEIAQPPYSRRGHEAGPDQAMFDQPGDPCRVGDVGLAAGDVAHVPGVEQLQFEGVFEQVVDRFPLG